MQYPFVSEFFSRSIQTVLATYMNPAIQAQTTDGFNVSLPQSDIAYSVKRLQDQPSTNPLIVFAGSRIRKAKTYKIKSDTDVGGFRYEFRCETPRTVYVRISLAGGDESSVFLQCSNIWDTLFAIFSSRLDLWNSLGIFLPEFPVAPIQAPDTDSILLMGTFYCELHVSFSRNMNFGIVGGAALNNATLTELQEAGLFAWQGPTNTPAPPIVTSPSGDPWPPLLP
jgi:hypothetical protein